MKTILDRFIRYISIDTQSKPDSKTTPSSKCQFDLLNLLKQELEELGLKADLSETGILMATLPANCEEEVPIVGFIAHVDTSPDAPGACNNPQIIENYDGKNIRLKGVPDIILSPIEFPELLLYKGQTLITTDGTSLLGADDKAGIAEIMTAIEYLVKHPEIKRGEVKIAFTSDEEIGRGTENFCVEKFGADFAFTVDGGQIGELQYENFNAASAHIYIKGINIHPGYAKDKMKNASLIGIEFNNLLPKEERPENTDGYEGFYHLINFKGEVEEATLKYIIRDHNIDILNQRLENINSIVQQLNSFHGEGTVTADIKYQYKNMKEKVEPYIYIIGIAKEAMEMEGITPIIKPIRGGTDGANLSYMGLPCPNIFTGGHNYHGKMEFIPLESMEKAAKVIVNIINLSLRR